MQIPSHSLFKFLVLATVLSVVSACHDGSSRRSGTADGAGLPQVDPPEPVNDFGLTLVEVEHINDRLLEITFETAALSAPTAVRILLPTDYEISDRRYPVIYLLHGAADDYRSWTDKGEAREATEGLPVIVVMPDAGFTGFYSDWHNAGAGGPPEWERYHIGQLMPWIDSHFRTIPERRGRAAMGLSMGGFGTFSYAARHPDLFVAAASFSGALDTNVGMLGEGIVNQETATPAALWGHRVTDEVRWRARNPWDLATNLQGLQLTLRTGNGQPGGPYDNGISDPVELLVWVMSTNMHNRLVELGMPHIWDDYGPGGHTWPYWQRELRKTLPDLMSTFDNPPEPPSPFSFTAVEPTYSVYGWTVAMDRSVLEFSRLEGANMNGFHLTGSGAAIVTTAAYYLPGAAYSATLTGPFEGNTLALVADPNGRLSIPLTLGPDNPYQQYTAQTRIEGTQEFTTYVTIKRADNPLGTD